MTRTGTLSFAALLFLTGVAISSCGGSIRYTKTAAPEIAEQRTGPPPHAPAHGYRHKHADGAELEYRSDLGVYVVIGRPDHYYYKDRYYRLNGGSWEASVDLSGTWAPAREKKLPSGLRNKKTCKKN